MQPHLQHQKCQLIFERGGGGLDKDHYGNKGEEKELEDPSVQRVRARGF